MSMIQTMNTMWQSMSTGYIILWNCIILCLYIIFYLAGARDYGVDIHQPDLVGLTAFTRDPMNRGVSDEFSDICDTLMLRHGRTMPTNLAEGMVLFSWLVDKLKWLEVYCFLDPSVCLGIIIIICSGYSSTSDFWYVFYFTSSTVSKFNNVHKTVSTTKLYQ